MGVLRSPRDGRILTRDEVYGRGYGEAPEEFGFFDRQRNVDSIVHQSFW
jgi:hypothetical protein